MESKKWMGKQRKWEKEEERREGCEKMEERKGELRCPCAQGTKYPFCFIKVTFPLTKWLASLFLWEILSQ